MALVQMSVVEQVPDRTQPLLPIDFGLTEQRTHDYKRYGTANLFAALNTATTCPHRGISAGLTPAEIPTQPIDGPRTSLWREGGDVRDDLEREYVEYFEVRMPHLRRLAVRLCGDFDRADDIVQTAATAIYTRWKLARAADNIDAYVRRTVVNTFLKERRSRWSRVALTGGSLDRLAATGQPIDERMVVRAAMRKLPPRQQAVLVLRFLCDLPVAEVAQMLGCAEGTVKSQTSDGLASLRRSLGGRAMDMGGTRRMA